MITLESAKALAARCNFRDWTIKVSESQNGETLYLQVLFRDKDRITGEEAIQRCRKWLLSKHMVESEVIRTAFKAVEAAMLHEVQEEFTFDGVRIFNPHFDLVHLASLGRQLKVSVRDETNYVPTDK